MISIGFGTNEKITSKLIRWATRSKWSHVWVEYPSGVWGGRWAAHSWSEGVVKVPLSHIERDYGESVLVYDIAVEMSDLQLGFDWAKRYISAPYEYGVVWNLFLLVLWRSTGWQFLHEVVHRNSAKLSCSEFVTGFLKAAGVRGAERLDPELTTPGELQEFCKNSDDFWVV